MNAWMLCNPILADWATSFWNDIDPDHRFVLLIVAIGCATGAICTIAAYASSTITAIHERRSDAELKREMIERGLSANEITQIIEVASPPRDATQRVIAARAKTS